MSFGVFTIGWEPYFVDEVLLPIQRKTGINFVHGQVGNADRVAFAKAKYPDLDFIALSKNDEEDLPEPDRTFLAGLECPGVPTIKSMIQGDRVLRFRSERESLGYATLLARRIQVQLKSQKPDVVLGTHDSIHSALGLAVAKSMGIPWVAMAFPVIPDDLTGFCYALSPNAVIPLGRTVDDEMRELARQLMQNVRSRQQAVMAYRAPASLGQWLRQYWLHARNLWRRKQEKGILGIDRFCYPTASERIRDVVRRTFNRLLLPTAGMLSSPPPGKFAYFPLHMAPESTVDTWAPFYQDQLAFAAQVALAIPADMSLVVKPHFSDPDNYSRARLTQLMAMANVYLAHPDAPGNEFLDQSTLVIGIQGTSSLEGALLGKPVLTFGDSPYQYFPRTRRARRPDQLFEQIQDMLASQQPKDEEIIEAYAEYMSRYLPGRTNDWSKPVTAGDIERFSECFTALGRHLSAPGVKDNWYDRPPFIN